MKRKEENEQKTTLDEDRKRLTTEGTENMEGEKHNTNSNYI